MNTSSRALPRATGTRRAVSDPGPSARTDSVRATASRHASILVGQHLERFETRRQVTTFPAPAAVLPSVTREKSYGPTDDEWSRSRIRGVAPPEFGRRGVEARSQGYRLGVHHPLLPVDEFANRVQVPGVTGRLSDHMEEDIAKIVQAPLTPGEGPPGQVGIGR